MLVPVGAAVQVGQPHAATDGVGQRVIQRQVLLAADDADGGEAEVFTRRSCGPDVVGVGAAESQQCAMTQALRLGEVVLQLAPLVPRHIRIDQVIPLESKPDPGPGQAVIA